MKISSCCSLLVLCVLFIPIAASADKSRAGSVKDGVYTSPDRSFQFDIPNLASPGDFVEDIRESENIFKVVMGDEMCRRSYVLQYAKAAYADLAAFTADRINAMQIVELESQELQDSYPDAVLATGGMPLVSTCAALTFDEGGQLVPAETAGSDVGVIFLEADDAYYELGYILDSERTFSSFYGGATIEEVIGKLFASFRVTGPRDDTTLPPVEPLIRFIADAESGVCEFIGPIKGKSGSLATWATVSEHMNKAKAKLRQEAKKVGANAIAIRESKMKRSGWTASPYMQMKADAFVCESVPEYMAWEIRATN